MNRKIIYLSGAPRPELVGDRRFGLMVTPNMGIRAERLDAPQIWGADTGCFSQKGVRAFDKDAYLRWLEGRDATACAFATAPDRVGDWKTTLKLSKPVLPEIRARGYKAALVLQDGATLDTVPWGTFDVAFIGGSTEFKLGPIAAQIAREAHRRGLWVHMGRVNSYKRFAYAASIECDSADGTFLAFGATQNLPRLLSWHDQLAAAPEPAYAQAA